MDAIIRFIKEEEGMSAEYGLLIALIALVMAVGATALGQAIDALFDATSAQMVVP